VQRIQRDIFFQVVGQAAQIGQYTLDLLRHRKHMGRQEAAQSQRVALFFREGGAFVEQRIAQQRHAARRIGRPWDGPRPDWHAHSVSPTVCDRLTRTFLPN
jgi:hypothetical protein